MSVRVVEPLETLEELGEPQTWPDRAAVPSQGQLVRAMARLDTPAAEIDAAPEHDAEHNRY